MRHRQSSTPPRRGSSCGAESRFVSELMKLAWLTPAGVAGDMTVPPMRRPRTHALISRVHARAQTDVLYVTRVQKERFEDPEAYEEVKHAFIVTPDTLARMMARARRREGGGSGTSRPGSELSASWGELRTVETSTSTRARTPTTRA